ncbi:MAG: HdeD family acid-resistance protein [Chlamydiia bacterium]|nr:HdeD family acid-resistance protein [Chlamydiia bacterium]
MRDTLETIHKNWGWFLASGIFLLVIGILAIGSSVFTTLFTMAFLGALLLIAGAIKTIYAFWAKDWSGFFLQLVGGLLYLFVGALIYWNPAKTAVALTLLMAIVFIISGAAKIIGSLIHRFPDWGWVFFSGLISLVLGGLILSEWPVSGLWIIGLFVGIDLIFYGWAWIIMALKAKNLPKLP